MDSVRVNKKIDDLLVNGYFHEVYQFHIQKNTSLQNWNVLQYLGETYFKFREAYHASAPQSSTSDYGKETAAQGSITK